MPMLESEKELEDFLFDSQEEGSPYFAATSECYDRVYRQVGLPGYGVIDLLYVDCNYHDGLRLHVVELKKGVIDWSAVAQIARYRQGLKDYIKLLFCEERQPEHEIIGSLIGSDLSDGVNYLIDSIEWLDCYSYSLDLAGGLKFNSECHQGSGVNWHRTDTDCSQLKPYKIRLMRDFCNSKRDYEKWRIEWEKSKVVDLKKR